MYLLGAAHSSAGAGAAAGAGALLAALPLPLLAAAAAGGLSSAGGSLNSPDSREYERVHTNVLSPASPIQQRIGNWPVQVIKGVCTACSTAKPCTFAS